MGPLQAKKHQGETRTTILQLVCIHGVAREAARNSAAIGPRPCEVAFLLAFAADTEVRHRNPLLKLLPLPRTAYSQWEHGSCACATLLLLYRFPDAY